MRHRLNKLSFSGHWARPRFILTILSWLVPSGSRFIFLISFHNELDISRNCFQEFSIYKLHRAIRFEWVWGCFRFWKCLSMLHNRAECNNVPRYIKSVKKCAYLSNYGIEWTLSMSFQTQKTLFTLVLIVAACLQCHSITRNHKVRVSLNIHIYIYIPDYFQI